MKRLLKNVPSNNYFGRRFRPCRVALHNHCRDDKESLLQLLKKAKSEGVKVLSINNYKNLNVFTDVLPQLSKKEVEAYKEIEIIPAIEMPAKFQYVNSDGKSQIIEVHILGYGVDIGKEYLLNEFCSNKYSSDIDQEKELERLKRIAHGMGLIFKDEDAYIDPYDDNYIFAGRAIMQALRKHMDENFCVEGEDNPNKLPFGLREDWRAFFNVCVKNLKSPFYLDVVSSNPEVSEVIDLIHKMGGKAYLAHPSDYFSREGTKENIERIYKEVERFVQTFIINFSPKRNSRIHIDGVEAYHPSYSGENKQKVIKNIRRTAKELNVGTSGGTDIHVDETLGSKETVSSDGLGGHITARKLKQFGQLRKKAIRMDVLWMYSKIRYLAQRKSEEYER